MAEANHGNKRDSKNTPNNIKHANKTNVNPELQIKSLLKILPPKFLHSKLYPTHTQVQPIKTNKKSKWNGIIINTTFKMPPTLNNVIKKAIVAPIEKL